MALRGWLSIIVGSCCVAGLFIIKINSRNTPENNIAAIKTKENARNKQLVDTAVSMLKSGFVVLRMGLGADSYLLAQMNRKNKTYSHCGIVMMENGYPFIYHSIGGEDNPDERMRRDSACVFFSPLHNNGIAVVSYDFDAVTVNKLRKIVSAYYRLRPKFDMKFDLKTDNLLYCAEFVYKAFNKAENNSSYIKTSHYLGYTFVGIDDLFINKHAQLLWQGRFE